MATESVRDVSGKRTARPARRWFRLTVALVVLIGLYYALGAFWFHRIDADPAFAADLAVPEGASRTVAVTAAVIDREVDRHRWLANDPFFMPTAVLDNAPSFQIGMVQALSRFTLELADHLTRARNSTQFDPDIVNASGRLRFPPDIWILEFSMTPIQASSDSQYRQAVRALERYNERLAGGNAVFERRSDNLIDTMQRIAADIGSSAAALSDRVDHHAMFWFDLSIDDLFYEIKGQVYAYYLVLRELRYDFAPAIEQRGAGPKWELMLRSLDQVNHIHPWVVMNNRLSAKVAPNHLAHQGFMLLRAHQQLTETIQILQN